MIERVLGFVFETLYAGQDGRRWLQDQRSLLQVLTWPATWLNERGIGLPVSRYEAKLREIIQTISKHGNRAEIKHVPAYLGDCIRKHFVHHGEALYEQQKHVRNALDLAFLKGSQVTQNEPDAVPALVKAHAVLATSRTRGKIQRKDDSQGTLF